MRLLAVETSSELCSAALVVDGQTYGREEEAPNRHGEVLLPMVSALLAEAGVGAAELDALAFGQGPGSFTGIRIGVGVVQGLALGVDRPVIPVPSLLAVAAQSGAGAALVAFDARMGEAYLGAYRQHGRRWEEALPPRLVTPQDEWPAIEGSDWLLCGNGFDNFGWLREAFARQGASHAPGLRPHARAIASVAREWLEQGRAVAVDAAAPLYLRDKVALTVAERRARA